MRLTLRLTLFLFLALGCVLAVNAVLRVQRETAAFEADMRLDHLFLAKSVATEALLEWQDHGEVGARAVVANINTQKSHVELALRTLDELQPHIAHALQQGPLQNETPDGASLRTFVPLVLRGALVGAIRLEEPLEPVHAYVRTSMLRTLVAALLALCFGGAISFWFGVLLVGRPIDALVEKMRRIADGDLSRPLVIDGRAELSTLAEEINRMTARLAEARTRAAEEAERRVAAVEQLRHADRLSTVGLLASGLAHELGTPLNIISGRAKMIESHALDERAKEDARTIARQSEKVTRIVRQLLDFARAVPGERRQMDVKRAVADTAALLLPMARERGVALELEVPQASPEHALMLHADAGQLEQALMNVIVNAIQASPRDGHVRIAVRAHDGGRVAIDVKDDGPGIAPEHLERVFLPFFTTKAVGEGTGLGLAVAYGIVQDHGGTLRVTSEVGKGTTFTFDLPAAAAAPAKGAA